MLNFVNKLFGSPNKNKLKSYSKTIESINNFEEKINKLSDDELIETFNKEVGNRGWVSARGYYLVALHTEFTNRGFDISEISYDDRFSIKHRVRLDGKKVIIM